MKLRQCQLSAACRCENRGEACLATKEERVVYNNIIEQMKNKLDEFKLPEEDSSVIGYPCEMLDEDDEIDLEEE